MDNNQARFVQFSMQHPLDLEEVITDMLEDICGKEECNYNLQCDDCPFYIANTAIAAHGIVDAIIHKNAVFAAINSWTTRKLHCDIVPCDDDDEMGKCTACGCTFTDHEGWDSRSNKFRLYHCPSCGAQVLNG